MNNFSTYNDATADALVRTLEANPSRWDVYGIAADRLEEIGNDDARAYRFCAASEVNPESCPAWLWRLLEFNDRVRRHMPGCLPANGFDTFHFAMWRLAEGLRRMCKYESILSKIANLPPQHRCDHENDSIADTEGYFGCVECGLKAELRGLRP